MQSTPSTGSKHFLLHSLAEGVFAAIAKDGGAAISNSGLIDLGDELLVFDTFLTPQAATDLRVAAVELLGRAPGIVVNSHYHNDHIWGNQVFAPEAQIVSSARTRELILTAGAQEFDWYASNSSERLASLRAQYHSAGDDGQRRQLLLWLGYYEGLVEAFPHLQVCMPGVTFSERLSFHGAQRRVELLTFQGAHTENDTVLHLPDEGMLFMSDLLFVGCHPYLADGDPAQLLKALRELSRMGAACLIPGHGPPGTGADMDLLIEYIEGCFETARALVESGDASEQRFTALKVPRRYRSWGLAGFYPANIRFLCERLSSANGTAPAA